MNIENEKDRAAAQCYLDEVCGGVWRSLAAAGIPRIERMKLEDHRHMDRAKRWLAWMKENGLKYLAYPDLWAEFALDLEVKVAEIETGKAWPELRAELAESDFYKAHRA